MVVAGRVVVVVGAAVVVVVAGFVVVVRRSRGRRRRGRPRGGRRRSRGRRRRGTRRRARSRRRRGRRRVRAPGNVAHRIDAEEPEAGARQRRRVVVPDVPGRRRLDDDGDDRLVRRPVEGRGPVRRRLVHRDRDPRVRRTQDTGLAVDHARRGVPVVFEGLVPVFVRGDLDRVRSAGRILRPTDGRERTSLRGARRRHQRRREPAADDEHYGRNQHCPPTSVPSHENPPIHGGAARWSSARKPYSTQRSLFLARASAADVGISGHEEPVAQLLPFPGRQADAGRSSRAPRRRRAVVDDAERPPHEAGPVERAVDGERLPELARGPSRGRDRAAPSGAAPRIVSIPSTGAAARNSTACACSPGPHTAFMHQWLP